MSNPYRSPSWLAGWPHHTHFGAMHPRPRVMIRRFEDESAADLISISSAKDSDQCREGDQPEQSSPMIRDSHTDTQAGRFVSTDCPAAAAVDADAD